MNGDFTTAEDLIRHPGDYVRVSGREIRRIVTLRTSGSTGAAKRLFFTEGDLGRTVRFFSGGMAPFTRPGDKAAVLIGSEAPDGLGRLVEAAYLALDAQPTLFGAVKEYDAAARALTALGPDTLVGLPAQVRRLALMCPALRPHSVLLSGDYIAESLRATVARLWQTTVYAHYGLTESGLGLAVECPAQRGYHIRADALAVEIVDPATGAPLPEGRWGEVVFTTLKQEAMPLRRYRTGDISRLLPGPCPCGDQSPRLDRVLGRQAELCKPVSIYALDELLLGRDQLLDYQAALNGNTLTVTVQLAPAAGPEALKKTEKLLTGAFPQFTVCVLVGQVAPTAAKRAVALEVMNHEE